MNHAVCSFCDIFSFMKGKNRTYGKMTEDKISAWIMTRSSKDKKHIFHGLVFVHKDKEKLCIFELMPSRYTFPHQKTFRGMNQGGHAHLSLDRQSFLTEKKIGGEQAVTDGTFQERVTVYSIRTYRNHVKHCIRDQSYGRDFLSQSFMSRLVKS